jgi:hypothetical protein
MKLDICQSIFWFGNPKHEQGENSIIFTFLKNRPKKEMVQTFLIDGLLMICNRATLQKEPKY